MSLPARCEPDDWPLKSQTVRVLDVFVIGPLMLWGGVALHDRSRLAGWALGLSGLATIVYNGRNWMRYRELMRDDRPA